MLNVGLVGWDVGALVVEHGVVWECVGEFKGSFKGLSETDFFV